MHNAPDKQEPPRARVPRRHMKVEDEVIKDNIVDSITAHINDMKIFKKFLLNKNDFIAKRYAGSLAFLNRVDFKSARVPVVEGPRPSLKVLRRKFEEFISREFDETIPLYLRHTMQDYLGLRKLGEGNFSNVFALGKKFVLKIVKNRDEGYRQFAEICMKNRNKHLPRVLYKGRWNDRDVYVMERLTSRTRGNGRQYLMEAIKMALTNPYISVADANVKEVATLLAGKTNDLRLDNVMAREDGTPVITDPY